MNKLNYFDTSRIELDLKAFSIKGNKQDYFNI